MWAINHTFVSFFGCVFFCFWLLHTDPGRVAPPTPPLSAPCEQVVWCLLPIWVFWDARSWSARGPLGFTDDDGFMFYVGASWCRFYCSSVPPRNGKPACGGVRRVVFLCLFFTRVLFNWWWLERTRRHVGGKGTVPRAGVNKVCWIFHSESQCFRKNMSYKVGNAKLWYESRLLAGSGDWYGILCFLIVKLLI